MGRFNLRIKILVSVGCIFVAVLGTTTFVHLQDLKRDYLEAIEWRSEALAQSILNYVVSKLQYTAEYDDVNVQGVLRGSSLQCIQLYELYKEKNVSHIAVINADEEIVAHNDQELWDASVDPALHDPLERQEQATVLNGTTYHTLIPIMGKENLYLGTIDIGIPKHIIDEKTYTFLRHSVVIFGIFFVVTVFAIFILVHVIITRPVSRLVTAGRQLAEGNLVQVMQFSKRKDEIGAVSIVFNQISTYMQYIAEIASHITTGILDKDVRVRSEYDVLGKAVHEMLKYLQHVSTVMMKTAEGDLTAAVHVRSATDAFGKGLRAMIEGLRSLIIQIRISTEQIAHTKTNISSLAARDIDIVEQAHTASEQMMSTMLELGASVEEVSNNMDTLSDSVSVTSSSVSEMTAAIAHIASSTEALTHQSQQTITSLNETVNSLENVVKNTDVSKQISQDTIHDAIKGKQAVEQVTSSMQAIQQTITTAVDTIHRFAQRSQDIDTILDVIRTITEQTSLLALNASIIAAQAGTHGRGFAVVADEIKELADGVGTSTKDIAQIVKTLQQDIKSVVQTIHAGAEDVKLGIDRTQQAQQALQKILTSTQRSSSVVADIADALHKLMDISRNVVTSMEQVDVMTDDITDATNNQNVSTNQINKAVEEINDMASQIQRAAKQQLNGVHQLINTTNDFTGLVVQNLASSKSIADATAALSSQADILLHSVDRFKLPVDTNDFEKSGVI